MNLFEKELRSMFGDNELLSDYKCCGNAFIAKLDDDLRVKLQFVTSGTYQKYTELSLKLINRTDGVVDEQRFNFADIIGMRRVGAYDKIEPHIWIYNNDISWYTPITSSEKEKIAEAVMDYVSMYQSEEAGMKMQ